MNARRSLRSAARIAWVALVGLCLGLLNSGPVFACKCCLEACDNVRVNTTSTTYYIESVWYSAPQVIIGVVLGIALLGTLVVLAWRQRGRTPQDDQLGVALIER